MDPDLTAPPAPTPPSGQDTIATVPSDGTDSRPATGDPGAAGFEDPTRIGRFVVIERLGAGGMGVVYAAFDPKLERKIAVKLVRPRPGSDEAGAQTRLLREAQAMAKLSDPNVIQVFDVGTHGEQVYIAMEFVKGTTLRKWLVRGVGGTRTRDEILDVFGRAGRGLAAAHVAGLIHRDFKPDNVLVGSDGRVRVSDFGLVRAEDDAVPGDLRKTLERTGAHAALGSEGLGVSLTQTGMVMGTPAYMAPEQFAGAPVDARTDQFAFCVTLWEALYGARPFAGKTAAELLYAVTQGELQDPPRGADVPKRLRRVLLRGLSGHPDERYPNMAFLLEDLERDPARTGRRVTGGVLLVGLVGGGVWAAAPTTAAPEDLRCRGFEEQLVGIWDEPRRTEVHEAIDATGAAYAGTVWDSVSATLDFYAEAWVEMKTATCEATQIRGEQSAELMDLKMACLDRRRDAMGAMVEVLAEADGRTVANGVRAVRSLDSLAACDDAEALRAAVPLPSEPARREAADVLSARLDRVKALYLAGQYKSGLELAEQTHTEAAALGHAPLEAQASYFLGSLLASSGKFADADPHFRRAYWRALASRNDQIMARAASTTAWNLGSNLAKDELADDWIQTAGAAVERWGLGTEEEARYLNQMALVYGRRGEHDRSFELHKRAMAVRGEALGKDHFMLGLDHLNLGVAYSRAGDNESAREQMVKSLAILEPAVGKEHPWVTTLQQNLSSILMSLGEAEQARDYAERALQVKIDTLGEDHPTTAMSYSAVGTILLQQGETARAREYVGRALAIREKANGPEHPLVAQTLVSLGDVLAASGDHVGALERYRKARGIYEKTDGKKDGYADTLNTEASVLRDMGRGKEALALHDEALAILEASRGADHPTVAKVSYQRALTLGALGRRADAITAAERSLGIFDAKKHSLDAARARLVLAYLYAADADSEGRADALRASAEAVFVEQGSIGQSRRDAIVAWSKTL